MKLNDYFKKRIFLFIISLLFISIVVVTSTYSLSINPIRDAYIPNNNHLLIEYVNGSDTLSVSEYPMNNDIGSIYAPANIIKIINQSNEDIKYNIIVTRTQENEIDDLSKIYVSINGNEPISLDNNIIYSGNISDIEETIDVRIWLSKEYMDSEDLGKIIGINLSIVEI
jgi:hypothetical protein